MADNLPKAKIEAALYAAGRPLSTQDLARASGMTSIKKVIQIARSLMENVNSTFDALQMVELEGQRFVIQLKTDFTTQARRFSSRQLLSKAELKTFSYVVAFQPISGKDLAEMRGPNSYQHVKVLIRLGFVKSEPHGRTRLFRTGSSFANYFGAKDLELLKGKLPKVGLKAPVVEGVT